MKRGGPLERRTPLRQKTPMKRTALKNRVRGGDNTRGEVRDRVRARSRGVCEMCVDAPGTNFHHRLRRSQGGQDSDENLLHLCGSGTTGCHGYIHANPSWSYLHGALLKRGQDPALVDFVR